MMIFMILISQYLHAQSSIEVCLQYKYGGDLGHDALPVLMCACTKYILTMIWFSLGDLLR